MGIGDWEARGFVVVGKALAECGGEREFRSVRLPGDEEGSNGEPRSRVWTSSNRGFVRHGREQTVLNATTGPLLKGKCYSTRAVSLHSLTQLSKAGGLHR